MENINIPSARLYRSTAFSEKTAASFGSAKSIPSSGRSLPNWPNPVLPEFGDCCFIVCSHLFLRLYPQSQYGPPEASVYSLTKSEAPPASLMV